MRVRRIIPMALLALSVAGCAQNDFANQVGRSATPIPEMTAPAYEDEGLIVSSRSQISLL